MIKLLKIKNVQKDFVINPGTIYNIDIENANLFFTLVNDLLNGNSETFIYSEDYKIIDFTKKTLVIHNIFDIDPNGKKILTSLYKKISDNIRKEDKQIVDEINSKCLDLLEKISFDVNQPIDYDTELDISKILILYKFCFNVDSSTPVENIITYIKANLEINNYSLVILINLLPLLSTKDIELLSKELSYLNLSIINLNLANNTYKNAIESITIDDDLCEF